MNNKEYEDLIDSLVESVTLNYHLDDSFDHYDAIIEVCENCNYYFEYYKAWQLVNFVRFDMYDNGEKIQLFDEAEMEVKELCRFDEETSLDDMMLSYAFQILKVATLKKYNEQAEVVA